MAGGRRLGDPALCRQRSTSTEQDQPHSGVARPREPVWVFFSPREEQNVLEAASSGAAASVGLVANIAANLIAFLAVLEFINAALLWFGEMVNIKDLSFQVSPNPLPIPTFARCLSGLPRPPLA